MVNFKEIYHFSRFQRGSNIFQGGSNFFQGGGGGVQLLISYINPCNVIFQGGSDPLSPPLDPHLDLQYWGHNVLISNRKAKRQYIGSVDAAEILNGY